MHIKKCITLETIQFLLVIPFSPMPVELDDATYSLMLWANSADTAMRLAVHSFSTVQQPITMKFLTSSIYFIVSFLCVGC